MFSRCSVPLSFFFFNDTATTEIYTLSLHDALPISLWRTLASRSPALRFGRYHRPPGDRKSTRLNSSHMSISYAVFCLKKKNTSRPTRTGAAKRYSAAFGIAMSSVVEGASFRSFSSSSFFFNDTATTEIYTLSLHDALPILRPTCRRALRSPPSPTSPLPSRPQDRQSTRLNSSHTSISYADSFFKKKTT